MNITVVSREIKNISYAKLLGGGGGGVGGMWGGVGGGGKVVGGRGWGQPRCTKAEVQMANDFFPFFHKIVFLSLSKLVKTFWGFFT